MRYGSLFSGIGGLDLGLDRSGMECAWQVEIDPYCRKVLAKHWPDVPKFEDIKDCGIHNLPQVDLICGGFPCTDISLAGKGAGIEGEKSGLWSEYHRIICELRPKFVLVENVSALLARGIDRVLGDLASCGYDAQWDCIPAGAFGTHFFRDRTFIIAADSVSSCFGSQRCWPIPPKGDRWSREEFERLVCGEIQHGVPAGSLGRISDGVPKRMDRLKGLGNAVVPDAAEYLGQMIMGKNKAESG